MARIKAVSEQFRIARQGTLEDTRQIVIATAKRAHAKVMATDPVPVTFTRLVDGHPGEEESVKPNGVILYNYPRIAIVAEYALDTLRKLSPVLSGDYVRGHILFLNGNAVDPDALLAWKEGDEVAISNIAPYTRKIEVGAMTMRVPGTDHVYQQAEQIVNAKYGNVARTRLIFRPLYGGGTALEKWAAGTSLTSGSRRPGSKGYEDWVRRQPALLIGGK
jgi:hypothetical protein